MKCLKQKKAYLWLVGGIRVSISRSVKTEACCLSHAADVDDFFSSRRERKMKSSLTVRVANILGMYSQWIPIT